jgi:hypothetical protein
VYSTIPSRVAARANLRAAEDRVLPTRVRTIVRNSDRRREALLSIFNYLLALPTITAVESDDEEANDTSANQFPLATAIAFNKLESHHSKRLPGSRTYEKLSQKLQDLIYTLNQNINYHLPRHLDDLAQAYYQHRYSIAQENLCLIIKSLARIRAQFRIGVRTAQTGGWSVLVRDFLALQPLYRLLHNSAYAYAKLLNVRFLPMVNNLYVLNTIIAVEPVEVSVVPDSPSEDSASPPLFNNHSHNNNSSSSSQ